MTAALRAWLAEAWCSVAHRTVTERHGDRLIVGCYDGCPTRIAPLRLSRVERERHRAALRSASELLRGKR